MFPLALDRIPLTKNSKSSKKWKRDGSRKRNVIDLTDDDGSVGMNCKRSNYHEEYLEVLYPVKPGDNVFLLINVMSATLDNRKKITVIKGVYSSLESANTAALKCALDINRDNSGRRSSIEMKDFTDKGFEVINSLGKTCRVYVEKHILR